MTAIEAGRSNRSMDLTTACRSRSSAACTESGLGAISRTTRTTSDDREYFLAKPASRNTPSIL